MEIKLNEIIYTIANVCMPTNSYYLDQIDTLKQLIDLLETTETANLIISGDFNIHMNELDSGNLLGTNKNNEFKKLLTQFLKEFNLIDIWRNKNNNESTFTRFRSNYYMYSRLE